MKVNNWGWSPDENDEDQGSNRMPLPAPRKSGGCFLRIPAAVVQVALVLVRRRR